MTDLISICGWSSALNRPGRSSRGPGGRPSLQGYAAPGAAAQQRRPHRGRTRCSLHRKRRDAL